MSDLSSSLSQNLGACVRELATSAPDDSELAGARQRLAQRLANQPARNARPPARAWLAFAAASLVAIVVLAVSPVAFRDGDAFAAVLRHLENFTTLGMTLQDTDAAKARPDVHLLYDRHGNARTDDELVSIIFNHQEKGTLMLIHGANKAMRMPLPKGSVPKPPLDPLAWIEKIREFKSKARKLPQTRVIDGRVVNGWSLEVDGAVNVIWADADGLPLEVELPGSDFRMRYRLNFDQVSADSFSLTPPAGYQLVERPAN